MSTALILLLACKGPASPDSGSGADTGGAAVDLVAAVPAGQARAGVVTDEAALFGGVASEGRAGDLMLKNDRVQFVVQSARLGDNYIGPGGGIIDADIVRPGGELGRDLLDEHVPMAGLARILEAESVTVVANGSDGSAAIVRAEGPVAPLALLTGAAESTSMLPTPEAWMVTDYILEPDSWLLRMESTIEWREDYAAPMDPGDLALVSYDVSTIWRPGAGLDGDSTADGTWIGALGDEGDVALTLMPEGEHFAESPLQDLLEAVGQIMVGLGDPAIPVAGETLSHSRYMGVGPDLATLSGAWLEARGAPVEQLTGVVLDEEGAPVVGARVVLRDASEQPLTLALTDEDGAWQATVAAGSVVDAVASARIDGIHYDVAPGASWTGPYARDFLNEQARDSLSTGGPGALARGGGVSDAVPVQVGTPAELVLPTLGWLELSVADGGPAKIELAFADGDPQASDATANDRRIVPGRSDGLAAEIFLGDGSITVPALPGDYSVLVHRGLTWEPVTTEVTVEAGQSSTLQVELERAYAPAGVLVGDPHSHAAPSNDASVTMEQRLLSEAAHGVQLHYGTDHDHVVDYRELLAPLGLDDSLNSVVADEVSPPLRGHFNAYPLDEAPDEQGHGAVRWWETWEEMGSTQGLFDAIRDMIGDEGGVIQANHPTDSGLIASAGYDLATGTIGSANKWSEDFDAIEVMNAGHYEDYLPYYLDMVARGLQPTPTGVSDGHGDESSAGYSVTFLDLGLDDPADFTPDDLRATMAAHATVVSRGPYIEAMVDGEWAPGRTLTGPVDLDVAVWGASFVQVDQLELWRDGELDESWAVEGDAPEQLRSTIHIEPEQDASYVLIAWGSQSMAPVYSGRTPWAMTAALRVDADGDGEWVSPLPSLVVD